MSARVYENGTNTTKYIKIKSGKAGVRNCANYIADEKKTVEPIVSYMVNDLKVINPEDMRHLITGLNCNAETVVDEFALSEKKYHMNKTEKIKEGQKINNAFHVVLSYKGKDVKPEEIHEMGLEFARRICGGEFQALVATHLNTGNYHNHVLINAYAMDGQHKFRDRKNVYTYFREIANEISIEHGLPIIINGKETWQKDKEAEKVAKILKNDYLKKNSEPPVIPEYNEYGEKIGLIEAILRFITQAITQGMQEGLFGSNNDLILPVSEIKKIDEAMELLKSKNISSIEELDNALRDLHKEYSPVNRDIQMFEIYIKNAEQFGNEAYKQSDAVLCPMQPKTKSDLFKALHNSNYMLTKKFSDIGEEEARRVIQNIRAEEKENLPESLIIWGRSIKKPELKPDRDRKEFEAIMTKRADRLEELKAESKEIREDIAELYKVKRMVVKYELLFEKENVRDKVNRRL